MADVNKGTKRKSSLDPVQLSTRDDAICIEENVDASNSNGCNEPASKCARKSVSPTPNLQTNVNAEETLVAEVSERDEGVSIEEISPKEVETDEVCTSNNIGATDKRDNCASEVVSVTGREHTMIQKCAEAQGTNAPDEVDAEAVITITFKDGVASEKYKTKFLNFVLKFPELSVVDLGDSLSVVQVVEESDESPKPKKHKYKTKTKGDLFTLDTSPVGGVECVRPKYSAKFKVSEVVEEEQAAAKETAAQTCFNCDGRHSLRDCAEPKDFGKIRVARLNFRSNQQSKSGKRYHLEPDQKYGHLKPGSMSDSLRMALGLRKGEIPAHVYKMRQLGYPPGWLEEAKVLPSELEMYDMEGKNVKKGAMARRWIDPEKIIEYPGFNAKPVEGCKDNNRLYHVPPYTPAQSKDAMIDYINKMVESSRDNLETCDMEIDANSDKECSPTSETGLLVGVEDTLHSPSLNDLESKKQELLAQLAESNEFLVIDEVTCADTKTGALETNDRNQTTPKQNAVKISSSGTPILKSSSPYSRLPPMNNFMKDVSPVINFENLPNSTGKYEQMSCVLEKVRRKLKDIQDKT